MTTMPQFQPYAASVNPDRRAKQISTPTERTTQRTILLQPASPPSTDGSEFKPNSVRAPVKRGPLSRAARETQRKLNHSIIEKARRTKINDALTSLKQLDLPKRVEVLEAAVSSSPKECSLCAKCSFPLSPSSSSSTSHPDHKDQPVPKHKRSLSSRSPPFHLDMSLEPSLKRPCLPSISSWFPNPDSVPVRHINVDPQLLYTAAHFPPNNTTGHLFPTQCNALATGLPSVEGT
ncbi:hypothetical protein J132_06836 [Termitomyces sp. J132]|nr:hypothetical protein J132_06836 [Termitomyces sp. J132]